MKNEEIEHWNNLYKNSAPIPPARILSENTHLLHNFPQASLRALDIACGLAENSFLLAKQGYSVDAWDNAKMAVDRVNQKAIETKLSVKASIHDVIIDEYPNNFYDVIILTHYLDQSISKKIMTALKSGGLLFFQSFTREKVNDSGPEEAKYRLKRNELLNLFPELKVIVYREEGTIGDVNQGFRNEAMLIAKKD